MAFPFLTRLGSRREFVERSAIDFARQNPGVVLYVHPRPCCVPRVVAEYRELPSGAPGPGAVCGAGGPGAADPRFLSPPASLRPVNGAVCEESLNGKSPEEISALVQKLATRSGLDIIRIRKPFHTDSPSIQGQWHPFTNKASAAGGLRPREPPTLAQGL